MREHLANILKPLQLMLEDCGYCSQAVSVNKLHVVVPLVDGRISQG